MAKNTAYFILTQRKTHILTYREGTFRFSTLKQAKKNFSHVVYADAAPTGKDLQPYLKDLKARYGAYTVYGSQTVKKLLEVEELNLTGNPRLQECLAEILPPVVIPVPAVLAEPVAAPVVCPTAELTPEKIGEVALLEGTAPDNQAASGDIPSPTREEPASQEQSKEVPGDAAGDTKVVEYRKETFAQRHREVLGVDATFSAHNWEMDPLLEESVATLQALSRLLEQWGQLSQELPQQLSAVERAIDVVCHDIELDQDKNARTGYQTYVKLRDLYRQRRIIKDRMAFAQSLSAMERAGVSAQNTIRVAQRLGERSYTSRLSERDLDLLDHLPHEKRRRS